MLVLLKVLGATPSPSNPPPPLPHPYANPPSPAHIKRSTDDGRLTWATPTHVLGTTLARGHFRSSSPASLQFSASRRAPPHLSKYLLSTTASGPHAGPRASCPVQPADRPPPPGLPAPALGPDPGKQRGNSTTPLSLHSLPGARPGRDSAPASGAARLRPRQRGR